MRAMMLRNPNPAFLDGGDAPADIAPSEEFEKLSVFADRISCRASCSSKGKFDCDLTRRRLSETAASLEAVARGGTWGSASSPSEDELHSSSGVGSLGKSLRSALPASLLNASAPLWREPSIHDDMFMGEGGVDEGVGEKGSAKRCHAIGLNIPC